MSTSSDTAGTATTTNRGAEGAGETGNGRLSAVSTKAADAYQAARDRTSAAYAAARERAGDVSQRAAESIDSAPLVAVVGGLALGAIAGALLPRTSREEQLLGTAGRRLTDSARDAVRAARDASREQLDGFTDRAMGALKSSAGAAADSVRKR
ncbi:MAG: hypothetical protein JOZ90_02275 [Alphaproteobacteria bacterium]|nr:hypothetical protein [Alphaproteobacteria bacterium]MBV9372554.1 hypothetical protein [Alphaproteobacteria bacterium]MBV9899904.1 hypothetical protein [Alphaproteobacteria bacterium]